MCWVFGVAATCVGCVCWVSFFFKNWSLFAGGLVLGFGWGLIRVYFGFISVWVAWGLIVVFLFGWGCWCWGLCLGFVFGVCVFLCVDLGLSWFLYFVYVCLCWGFLLVGGFGGTWHVGGFWCFILFGLGLL